MRNEPRSLASLGMTGLSFHDVTPLCDRSIREDDRRPTRIALGSSLPLDGSLTTSQSHHSHRVTDGEIIRAESVCVLSFATRGYTECDLAIRRSCRSQFEIRADARWSAAEEVFHQP